MSETNNSGDKTLSANPPPKPTLHLKRPVEQGTVRQSFSHGRSKAVVVEKVKRRILTPAEAAAAARAAPTAPAAAGPPPAAALTASARPAPVAPAKPTAPPPPKTGVVLPTLTAEQREARARALIDARASEEDDRRRQEADAGARREREARDRLEREAAEARKRDEELRRAQEANFKRQSEDEARRRLSGGEPAPSPSIPRVAPTAPGAALPGALARAAGEEEETKRVIRRPALVLPGQKVIVPTPRPARGGEQRNRGRLTVTSATSGEEERTRSIAAFRRRTQRLQGHGAQDEKEKIAREIVLPEAITIQELAGRMSERAVDVIKLLMRQGRMVTLTDTLDADTAQLVAEEMGHSVKRVAESDVEEGLFDRPDEDGATVPRPPIVTIMGHVDHGKTSLLDAIRHANVVAGEAGGITQHIGAYQVAAPGGQTITFIDTPGHAAFTAMRARGAKVTDVVVLVVAADDGVMPQTIEAIQHARAANVPIVVAVNKIDKSDADPERVRSELAKQEVVPEEWGGSSIFVNVSARTGAGIDKLLEAILLQAEILELRAPTQGLASAFVVESSIEKGRGAVVTVIVKKGTLRLGDAILAGTEYGRVRAMFDEAGAAVTEAAPSVPVVVLGLSDAPNAGDELLVVESERKAREVALYRQGKFRDNKLAKSGTRAEDAFSQLGEAKIGIVQVLIKTDVQGSAEALRDALTKLSTEEVQARVIASGVGGITASDIQLAAASRAVVIGFNVRADAGAREAVKETGVDVRYYSIIYEAIDDVKQMMSGLLAPEIKEQIVGVAQVREVFRSSKFGVVAGCLVTEGTVKRNNPIRVLRDNVVIFEGALESLRGFKDDVGEVRAGTECGIGVKNYQDVRAGDQIECYFRTEVTRTIQ